MTNTARLRELLAAATPGPWEQGKWGVYADAAVNFDNENGAGMIASICTGFENGCEPAANMQLIVEAVNALPKLLDKAERLEKLEALAKPSQHWRKTND